MNEWTMKKYLNKWMNELWKLLDIANYYENSVADYNYINIKIKW